MAVRDDKQVPRRWTSGPYPGMPVGSYRNSSLRVKKGDTIRVDGWYNIGTNDPRIEPTPAGPHLGVMSYFVRGALPLSVPPFAHAPTATTRTDHGVRCAHCSIPSL